jgi:hypothetical protein
MVARMRAPVGFAAAVLSVPTFQHGTWALPHTTRIMPPWAAPDPAISVRRGRGTWALRRQPLAPPFSTGAWAPKLGAEPLAARTATSPPTVSPSPDTRTPRHRPCR